MVENQMATKQLFLLIDNEPHLLAHCLQLVGDHLDWSIEDLGRMFQQNLYEMGMLQRITQQLGNDDYTDYLDQVFFKIGRNQFTIWQDTAAHYVRKWDEGCRPDNQYLVEVRM